MHSREALDINGVLSGVPNVTMAYYDVYAITPAAIRNELNSKLLRDPSGATGDSLTEWHYSWRWKTEPGRECETQSAEIVFRAKVTLPKLVDRRRLDASTDAAWRRYMNALIEHEAEHVRLAYAGRSSIESAVRGATCTAANAAGNQAANYLRQQDIDFDRRTGHGLSNGAVFPPRS
jgi:predicted secreted Zn-dependent protease